MGLIFLLPLLFYLVKTFLVSALFFGYYRLFLRNKPFHGYNRAYLLCIPVLSLVLPLVHIPLSWGNSLWTSAGSAIPLNNLHITAGDWNETSPTGVQTPLHSSLFSWQFLAPAVYVLISILLCRVFLRQLFYIRSLKAKYKGEKMGNILFFCTREPGTPFSFLCNMFWDEQIDRDSPRGKEVFRHERCHIRQKHTLDILWMRVLMILFWINPIFRLIYRELRIVHEFQADDSAISDGDPAQYAELLIWQTVSTPPPSLLHPFFHSSIKRRITMIIQSKTRGRNYVTRIMTLPLLILLCSAFATGSGSAGGGHLPPHAAKKPLTVIIDPGHGGIDPGAKNAAGVLEKDLVLQIAKRIQEQATQYPFKVILTRTTDALPGNAANKKDGLDQRIAIAAANKADLFISLHVNSSDGGTPRGGIDAYIASDHTDTGSTQLATSLLQQLSRTYAVSPLLKQRDGRIAVLDHSPCPAAVLLELGYIDLPKDCQFILSPDNQGKIAHDILEGIAQYALR